MKIYKNFYLSFQWEHFGQAFPIKKDMVFTKHPLIEVAPYIFSGFATAKFKRHLSAIIQ
ncbi:MAG: hypothetical protein ACTSUT_07225 [Promethearchaeota archaeon]